MPSSNSLKDILNRTTARIHEIYEKHDLSLVKEEFVKIKKRLKRRDKVNPVPSADTSRKSSLGSLLDEKFNRLPPSEVHPAHREQNGFFATNFNMRMETALGDSLAKKPGDFPENTFNSPSIATPDIYLDVKIHDNHASFSMPRSGPDSDRADPSSASRRGPETRSGSPVPHERETLSSSCRTSPTSVGRSSDADRVFDSASSIETARSSADEETGRNKDAPNALKPKFLIPRKPVPERKQGGIRIPEESSGNERPDSVVRPSPKPQDLIGNDGLPDPAAFPEKASLVILPSTVFKPNSPQARRKPRSAAKDIRNQTFGATPDIGKIPEADKVRDVFSQHPFDISEDAILQAAKRLCDAAEARQPGSGSKAVKRHVDEELKGRSDEWARGTRLGIRSRADAALRRLGSEQPS